MYKRQNIYGMTEAERKQIIALVQREVVPAIGCTEVMVERFNPLVVLASIHKERCKMCIRDSFNAAGKAYKGKHVSEQDLKRL